MGISPVSICASICHNKLLKWVSYLESQPHPLKCHLGSLTECRHVWYQSKVLIRTRTTNELNGPHSSSGLIQSPKGFIRDKGSTTLPKGSTTLLNPCYPIQLHLLYLNLPGSTTPYLNLYPQPSATQSYPVLPQLTPTTPSPSCPFNPHPHPTLHHSTLLYFTPHPHSTPTATPPHCIPNTSFQPLS